MVELGLGHLEPVAPLAPNASTLVTSSPAASPRPPGNLRILHSACNIPPGNDA
jgi:hypothetical protein